MSSNDHNNVNKRNNRRRYGDRSDNGNSSSSSSSGNTTPTGRKPEPKRPRTWRQTNYGWDNRPVEEGGRPGRSDAPDWRKKVEEQPDMTEEDHRQAAEEHGFFIINVENDGGARPPRTGFDAFLFSLMQQVNDSNRQRDAGPTQEAKKGGVVFEYDPAVDYIETPCRVKTLQDLIDFCKDHMDVAPEDYRRYTIDLEKIKRLLPVLEELNDMIGMEEVKNTIARQIIYFLQAFEEHQHMLHTIIQGPPGVGKTMVGCILAKVYHAMGFLKKKASINPVTGRKEDYVFRIVKRSDLVGEYLGHTAVKTQKVIDECAGGVMFIDEAYSLGHPEKNDSFSKECIDIINQNLSENKNAFVCIIAGYPEQLEKCFFSNNEGLRRRFPFCYTIEKYNSRDLAGMLVKKLKNAAWNLAADVNIDDLIRLIDGAKEEFGNYGGDIENWVLHAKIAHSERVFGLHPRLRKHVSLDDLKNGLELKRAVRRATNPSGHGAADPMGVGMMYL